MRVSSWNLIIFFFDWKLIDVKLLGFFYRDKSNHKKKEYEMQTVWVRIRKIKKVYFNKIKKYTDTSNITDRQQNDANTVSFLWNATKKIFKYQIKINYEHTISLFFLNF